MIAVDWGSSSLRGYLLDDNGAILDQRADTRGILGCDGNFAAVLADLVDGWPGTILMSGMIGSRNGWIEQPYLPCPATLDDVAAALHLHQDPALPGRALWFVPGVAVDASDATPDVMRGEETQLFGLDLHAGSAQVCLPGTHSKWATLRAGAITGFATAMTGELFALLRTHSLLGRLMDDGQALDAAAFARGVERSGEPGGLLHHLFGVRALGLFDRLSPSAAPSCLSGLLVGHEIAALADPAQCVHLVGSAGLTERYALALAQLGFTSAQAPESLAARGLYRIAKTRGVHG
jgi:2-dehydro-3-deoxygalactonokinase